jgi:uncharacterized protein Usg
LRLAQSLCWTSGAKQRTICLSINAFDEATMRSDFEKQLEGYGLTTAEILYRLPDHPSVLQTYIWQEYDLAPDYPAMHGFLRFWQDTLDGLLHSVRYTHRRLIAPREWRTVQGGFIIH